MAQATTYHGFPDAHEATTHPDPARIGALGATMALNLGALLVLAMPMQSSFGPQVLAPPPPPRPIEFITERPPLPPPLVPVPVRPAATQPTPATRPAPTPEPPVMVREGPGPVVVPVPALPGPPQPPVAEAGGDAGPAAGSPAALRYITAPAPPYPRAGIRAGLTGTVWLRVLVDEAGRPVSVEVDQSSGHRVLDDAARRQVLAHWRFQAALQDGQPMQAWGRMPIEFRLDR